MAEINLEPEEIETITDVVKQLLHHRQTHTLWVNWFENNPSDNRAEYLAEYLGDTEFHRKVEARYTKMIEILESMGFGE